ncbi:hypothetical protein AAMO2058_001118600 [Amorphochlora amoebiformis]
MSFFSQIGDFASNLLAQVEEADEYYKGPTSGQMQEYKGPSEWECVWEGGVNVRDEPCTDGKEVGSVEFGEVVVALEYNGPWIRHSAGWTCSAIQGHVLLKCLGPATDVLDEQGEDTQQKTPQTESREDSVVALTAIDPDPQLQPPPSDSYPQPEIPGDEFPGISIPLAMEEEEKDVGGFTGLQDIQLGESELKSPASAPIPPPNPPNKAKGLPLASPQSEPYPDSHQYEPKEDLDIATNSGDGLGLGSEEREDDRQKQAEQIAVEEPQSLPTFISSPEGEDVGGLVGELEDIGGLVGGLKDEDTGGLVGELKDEDTGGLVGELKDEPDLSPPPQPTEETSKEVLPTFTNPTSDMAANVQGGMTFEASSFDMRVSAEIQERGGAGGEEGGGEGEGKEGDGEKKMQTALSELDEILVGILPVEGREEEPQTSSGGFGGFDNPRDNFFGPTPNEGESKTEKNTAVNSTNNQHSDSSNGSMVMVDRGDLDDWGSSPMGNATGVIHEAIDSREVENLRAELEAVRLAQRETIQEIEHMRKSKEEAEKRARDALEAQERLESELAAANAQYRTVVAHANREMEEVEAARTEWETNRAQIEGTNRALEMESKDLKDEIKELKDEILRLEEVNTVMEAKLAKQALKTSTPPPPAPSGPSAEEKEKIKHMEGVVEDLQKKVEKERALREVSEATMEKRDKESRSEMEALKNEIQHLTTELENTTLQKTELEMLQRTRAMDESSLQETQQSLTQMERMYEHQTQLLEDIKNKYNLQTNNYEEAKKELVRLQALFERATQAWEDREEGFTRQIAVLKAMRSGRRMSTLSVKDRLKMTITDLKQELKEAKASSTQQIQTLERALEEASGRFELQEEKLKEQLNSETRANEDLTRQVHVLRAMRKGRRMSAQGTEVQLQAQVLEVQGKLKDSLDRESKLKTQLSTQVQQAVEQAKLETQVSLKAAQAKRDRHLRKSLREQFLKKEERMKHNTTKELKRAENLIKTLKSRLKNQTRAESVITGGEQVGDDIQLKNEIEEMKSEVSMLREENQTLNQKVREFDVLKEDNQSLKEQQNAAAIEKYQAALIKLKQQNKSDEKRIEKAKAEAESAKGHMEEYKETAQKLQEKLQKAVAGIKRQKQKIIALQRICEQLKSMLKQKAAS